MASVAWITLCGVLVAGFVCLLLCRAILRSTTTGVERTAAAGLIRMASDSSLSSRQSSLVASAACCGFANTPGRLKRRAPSHGSQMALFL